MGDLLEDTNEFPDADMTYVCPWCGEPLWQKCVDDVDIWYCDEISCPAAYKGKKWDLNGHAIIPEVVA
jgi:ribosomal protein L37AE/L43A